MLPDKAADFIEHDLEIGLFHPGKDVFLEEGMLEFRLEKDDQTVFFFLPLYVFNGDELQKVDLGLFSTAILHNRLISVNCYRAYFSPEDAPCSPEAIIFL